MKTILCGIPLAASLLLAIAPAANANLITNGSFEVVSPGISTNEICATTANPYYPICTATGWAGTYQIGNGATHGTGGSSFNIPQPDPNGSNALILQGISNATESFSAAASGIYTLTFDLANRSNSPYNGPQFVDVLLDGTLLAGGAFSSIPYSWTLETLHLHLAPGTHTLNFEGLGNSGRDVTAFIDNVSLTSAASATPEPAYLSILGLSMVAISIKRKSLRAN